LIRSLAQQALRGSEEFTVRPLLPLYLPGEPVQLDIVWHSSEFSATLLTVRITIFPDSQPSSRSVTTVTLPSSQPPVLPAPSTKGLHMIEAELLEGDKVRRLYRSGFWMRDEPTSVPAFG
jgi:hypothetical protein